MLVGQLTGVHFNITFNIYSISLCLQRND